MHSRDPRIPTMRGWSIWGFHRPGRHRFRQARSAMRCSASCVNGGRLSQRSVGLAHTVSHSNSSVQRCCSSRVTLAAVLIFCLKHCSGVTGHSNSVQRCCNFTYGFAAVVSSFVFRHCSSVALHYNGAQHCCCNILIGTAVVLSSEQVTLERSRTAIHD